MLQPVKGRTEAGRRREARAHDTRRRIIDAGLRLFLDNGYVETTVQGIAEKAGVAPATVYQAFGTKHTLLAAALDRAVGGDDTPVAVLDQDWVDEARHEPDPQRQLRLIVDGASRIAARTAPLKEVLRDAAATEPAARQLISEDHERRHRTQEGLVDVLIEHRPLPRWDRPAPCRRRVLRARQQRYLRPPRHPAGLDAVRMAGLARRRHRTRALRSLLKPPNNGPSSYLVG